MKRGYELAIEMERKYELAIKLGTKDDEEVIG